MTPAGRRSAKDRALGLLGHRARSRSELSRRLLRAGYPEEEAKEALDDLEAVGLVDDERFARELAAHEIQRRGSGRRLAISALRGAGVNAEVAERVVEEMGPVDEEARAEEMARARLGRLSGLDEATAHRRLVSFLSRRGYEGAVARAAAFRVLSDRVED
ncbi:MAG TPA: regulatory protein RecX [Actinomycetota bacterium]|jgi:regulatory protein|nr:regulatory protein RecX [Actinomycetota bacterium]